MKVHKKLLNPLRTLFLSSFLIALILIRFHMHGAPITQASSTKMLAQRATITTAPSPTVVLTAPTKLQALCPVPGKVTFTWSPVPGAANYRFANNPVAQGSTPVFTNSTQTNIAPGTTVNWYVAAERNGELGPESHSTATCPALPPPTSINVSCSGATATLSWTASSGIYGSGGALRDLTSNMSFSNFGQPGLTSTSFNVPAGHQIGGTLFNYIVIGNTNYYSANATVPSFTCPEKAATVAVRTDILNSRPGYWVHTFHDTYAAGSNASGTRLSRQSFVAKTTSTITPDYYVGSTLVDKSVDNVFVAEVYTQSTDAPPIIAQSQKVIIKAGTTVPTNVNLSVTIPPASGTYTLNCKNLTGPSSITLGQSATFTATVSSPGPVTVGTIGAGNSQGTFSWFSTNTQVNSSTEMSITKTWTPVEAGTYVMMCAAHNNTKECVGSSQYASKLTGPDGSLATTCAGPSAYKTLVVSPPSTVTPTVPKCASGETQVVKSTCAFSSAAGAGYGYYDLTDIKGTITKAFLMVKALSGTTPQGGNIIVGTRTPKGSCDPSGIGTGTIDVVPMTLTNTSYDYVDFSSAVSKKSGDAVNISTFSSSSIGTDNKMYLCVKPTTTVSPSVSPTVPTTCVCGSNNSCDTSCTFAKYSTSDISNVSYSSPIGCSLSSVPFSSTATQTNKNQWCQRNLRTKGDATGDGKVDDLDYFYYVQAVSGGTLPIDSSKNLNVNPDFNGNGSVGTDDRIIIIHALQNGL